jgi:hypothetical protein
MHAKEILPQKGTRDSKGPCEFCAFLWLIFFKQNSARVITVSRFMRGLWSGGGGRVKNQNWTFPG